MSCFAPRVINPAIVHFTREESLRVDRYVVRVGGTRIAQRRLGVGEHTLDAAREEGRMQRKTRDRLLAALEFEEMRAS